MPGKPLTPEENECLRAHLRELLKRYGDSQSALAPKLGVAQGTISAFLSGKQGSGYHMVKRVAAELGRDEREVIGSMPGKGPPVPPPGERARDFAAELARQEGVHEEAIESVLGEPMPPEPIHATVLWWADRMRWRERELVAARPAAPTIVAKPSTPQLPPAPPAPTKRGAKKGAGPRPR